MLIKYIPLETEFAFQVKAWDDSVNEPEWSWSTNWPATLYTLIDTNASFSKSNSIVVLGLNGFGYGLLIEKSLTIASTDTERVSSYLYLFIIKLLIITHFTFREI